MKHKQLSEAVSALEQEKDAAELSRFEESRRRGELQDKVLQLEMDMLKMRSTLEKGGNIQSASIQKNPRSLSSTLPVTQEDFYRQGKQKAEKELIRLKEALREAEERAELLEAERDQAIQQLHSSKETQLTVLSQTEETNQRLSHTIQSHSELQDQLSEARSKLGQASLERDLLSTKVLRMEDSVEDLKAKMSGALSDKDRLLQEKADLHQKAQGLELQLERAQRGREGFTDQVCELHDQLAEAKASICKQGQETLLLTEELHSVREVNEKLKVELEMVKQKLETALIQQHELGAERVIHTNQIAALETERSQLIGEKEELLNTLHQEGQEELDEVRRRCDQLREFQEALESDNHTLRDRGQHLEAELRERQQELQEKEAERQRMTAETAQSTVELRGVASHWSDKWQEVALRLQSTQGELESLKQNNPVDALQKEASELTAEVERLKTESQKDRDQIQNLLQNRADSEADLSRVKKETASLLRLELDACKQQLELEANRSQSLLHTLKGRGKGRETVDRGTEMDVPPETVTQPDTLDQRPSGTSTSPKQVSLEEVDGELGLVKVELQKVWDMLRDRDSELEEQHQELQSARGQMNQQISEVQRLDLELTEREQELREKEHSLRSLERLRDAERTEAQIKISALELKLVTQKDQAAEEGHSAENQEDVLNALRSQLEESRRQASQLEKDRDQAVQRLQTLRQLHQSKEGKPPLDRKRKGEKEEKTAALDIVDQEKQRRLVTEQLKTLFKERELQGQTCDLSAGDPSDGRTQQSTVIKNAVETLQSQRKEEQQQEPLRDRGHQQGAGLRPEQTEQERREEVDCPDRKEEEQKEVACLRDQLHNKAHMPS
ncbi:trichohyalin-like [Hypomesus transpacificus]|uniref:trichohyalin-like n=1 Tax=Hypomesus transpacificus TaxID=137520 RepID=UPI001F08746B|nr:trichohyalin-like [Hypomesus transpacificus]